MYKVLFADKDTYITNRVIKDVRVTSANIGSGGSLDLYKLYGMTFSGSLANTELTRLLVHYDLSPLRSLVSAGKLDTSHPSFSVTLKLFDVYGGQPTPQNFNAVVSPLSMSFDEGQGRDVVQYADNDVANFLTASRAHGTWHVTGCGLGGGLPGSIDYVTASTLVGSGTSLESTQLFVSGEENLEVDVTLAISATLAGLVPDEGFRISLNPSLELDQHSYFVKRFGSRTAYNEEKRPRLVVRYDDSVQDDTLDMTFDSPSSLFLYNYARQAPSALTSGSSLIPVVGKNCLILKLSTEVSGGTYELAFTGSQHYSGINPVVGIYSSSFVIPSTNVILNAKLQQSGSVKIKPIWGSLDGTTTYLTGSTFNVYPAQRGSTNPLVKRPIVNVIGLKPSHRNDEFVTLKVDIFDDASPLVILVKSPVQSPGLVIRDVHYQVKNALSGDVVIPFDQVKNSTRVSSDGSGMFFVLDTSNLTVGRSYDIDVKIVANGTETLYQSASPAFRVNNTP